MTVGRRVRVMSASVSPKTKPSTSENPPIFAACATLIEEMAAAGETGSVVTLLCDGGDRYAATYYDDAWLEVKGIDWRGAEARIARLLG